MTEEADLRVRQRMEDGHAPSPVLVVLDPLVTPGIAGLVASRLVDEYHRPAVVMSMVDGMLRGSARSIPEFDVGGALEICGDLFVRHGGHRAAAGFEMDPGKLPDLEARLCAIAGERLDGLPERPPLCIDAELPVSHLVGDTFRWLKRLEPFGAANLAPAFLTRDMEPLNVRPVGSNGRHLRMKLRDGGGRLGRHRLPPGGPGARRRFQAGRGLQHRHRAARRRRGAGPEGSWTSDLRRRLSRA